MKIQKHVKDKNLRIYSIKSPLASITDNNTPSEPGAGTHNHISVHSWEYLRDWGNQTGLDAIRMSLKFAPDKIAYHLEIWASFGRFMVIKQLLKKSQIIKRAANPWLCLKLISFLLEIEQNLFSDFFLLGIFTDRNSFVLSPTGRPVSRT